MRRSNLNWAVLVSAALATFSGHAAETIAIVGGQVHTLGSNGVIDGGTVVIENGRVASVTESGQAPQGARIIDAKGKYVVPGFMNGLSQVGLFETPYEPVEAADSHGESVLNAAFDVRLGWNPESVVVSENRRRGLTHVVVAPTSTVNLLNPGASKPGVDDMFYGSSAIAMLDGSWDTAMTRGPQVVSIADGGHRNISWGQLRVVLDQVRQYQRHRQRILEGKWNGEFLLSPFNMDALIPVVEGEQALVILLASEIDIRQAIEFKQEQSVEVILVGAAEAWKVADQLAAAEVPVLINPLENLPRQFLTMGATFENAAKLEAAGVKFGIVAPPFVSAHRAYSINQSAGIAVAHGLSWGAALEALSLAPAQIFGIDDQLGSIEPGKIANIVVWDGDPLEVASMPANIIVGGKEMPVTSRQTMLRDKYLAK